MPAETKTDPPVCRWVRTVSTSTWHIFRGGKSLCGLWSLDASRGTPLLADKLVAPSPGDCPACVSVFNNQIVAAPTEVSK